MTHSKNKLVPPELRTAMLTTAVYSTFIDSLPLHVETVRILESAWSLDLAQVERFGIRQCPTVVENIMASGSCAQRYGDCLNQVSGFYFHNRLPCVCRNCDFCEFWWIDSCVCALKTWRVDLDPKLSQTGIIVPQRNWRGWISRLWIFRHPGDQCPFPLTVRGEAVAA